jgi:hypothetical protein
MMIVVRSHGRTSRKLQLQTLHRHRSAGNGRTRWARPTIPGCTSNDVFAPIPDLESIAGKRVIARRKWPLRRGRPYRRGPVRLSAAGAPAWRSYQISASSQVSRASQRGRSGERYRASFLFAERQIGLAACSRRAPVSVSHTARRHRSISTIGFRRRCLS